MHPRLQAKFNKLEVQKSSLLTELKGWKEAQIHERRHEKQWSAGQVLQHVMKSEEMSVAYIKKKLQYSESIPKSGLLSALRSIVLMLGLAAPIKYKAPRAISTFPDDIPLPELITRWDAIRNDWNNMLETLPDEMIHRDIFKHPVVGKMNMPQALDFLSRHLNHHILQVERIKRGL